MIVFISDYSDVPNIGDYFVLRITEDPVFGTPVFTTIGGQSKCPGETATSRREGSVFIAEIVPRCGPNRDLPCDYSLNPSFSTGDLATFGLVLQNLSPTEDTANYFLQVANSFDAFHSQGYQITGEGRCGTPGQLAGLQVTFSTQSLQNIPFNRLVEVAFTASNSGNNGGAILCSDFVDVQLRIISSCEMQQSQSGSRVYQYGVQQDPASGQVKVVYDKAHLIWAANSTATFSVHWPPSSNRRKLQRETSEIRDGDIDNLSAKVEALEDLIRSVLVAVILLSLLVVLLVMLFCIKLAPEKAIRG